MFIYLSIYTYVYTLISRPSEDMIKYTHHSIIQTLSQLRSSKVKDMHVVIADAARET